MKKYLRMATKKLQSNKLIAAFLVVSAVTVLSSTSIAGAMYHGGGYAPIEKTGDASVCYGGEWQTIHRWHWWHRYRVQVWVPNWEGLGFDSRRECVRYMSTPAPTSRSECRREWWSMGFDSRSACYRYLRYYPGGGYDGENHGHHGHDDWGWE